MVKNTGIPENQLSDYDLGSVLKDSHNKPLHALDVNQINSLIPSSFSKVEVTYNDCGNPSIVKYYGLGLQEKFSFNIGTNPQGTYEISTFAFTSQNATDLGGKYIIIYDSSGSVGAWFNLDSSSVQPTTGADRDIEVSITTGDSTSVLASNFATTLDSDSEFSGSALLSLSVIQSSTVGDKTDATQGDTSIPISIESGISSLQGKSFDIAYNDNTDNYTFYYSIDGDYSPYVPDTTDYEIALTSSDYEGQISIETASVIDELTYLTSTYSGVKVLVDYLRPGNSDGFTDIDTDFVSTTIQEGEDIELVSTVFIEYDDCNNITGVERV